MPNFERKRILNLVEMKINDYERTRKTFLVEVYDLYVEEYVHFIVYHSVECFQDGGIIQARFHTTAEFWKVCNAGI